MGLIIMKNKKNKIMNQEKCCKNCKGYPDGDYGQCANCHRMIASSPKEEVVVSTLSPQSTEVEKDIEEEFIEILEYSKDLY